MIVKGHASPSWFWANVLRTSRVFFARSARSTGAEQAWDDHREVLQKTLPLVAQAGGQSAEPRSCDEAGGCEEAGRA